MADSVETYKGSKLVIRFDGAKCIHSRNCVLGRPDVFRANVQGPWIDPDGASTEALVATAQACPSGAVTYERLDGGAEETAPPVNLVRVRENGPLAFHGALTVAGQPAGFRATLCRCGASKNKPYCDGTHVTAGFTATGEPAPQDSQPLEHRNGPVTVTPAPNGPLLVAGNVEVVTGTGHTINRTQKCALCRCGGSASKPYCDGTHARIGFKS